MSSTNPPNQSGELYPSLFGRKYALVDQDLDLAAEDVHLDAHLGVVVRQSPARSAVVGNGLAGDVERPGLSVLKLFLVLLNVGQPCPFLSLLGPNAWATNPRKMCDLRGKSGFSPKGELVVLIL